MEFVTDVWMLAAEYPGAVLATATDRPDIAACKRERKRECVPSPVLARWMRCFAAHCYTATHCYNSMKLQFAIIDGRTAALGLFDWIPEARPDNDGLVDVTSNETKVGAFSHETLLHTF